MKLVDPEIFFHRVDERFVARDVPLKVACFAKRKSTIAINIPAHKVALNILAQLRPFQRKTLARSNSVTDQGIDQSNIANTNFTARVRASLTATHIVEDRVISANRLREPLQMVAVPAFQGKLNSMALIADRTIGGKKAEPIGAGGIAHDIKVFAIATVAAMGFPTVAYRNVRGVQTSHDGVDATATELGPNRGSGEAADVVGAYNCCFRFVEQLCWHGWQFRRVVTMGQVAA